MNYRPFQFSGQYFESFSINEEFPMYCFYKSNITNITIGENIEIIPPLGFAYSEVESINLENIKLISSNSFLGCMKLIHIRFSDKLEYIGPYAFDECHNLQSIIINTNKTIEVGDGAFKTCGLLNSNLSNIASVIRNIPRYCFSNNYRRENNVVLHPSVKTLGMESFYMFAGSIKLNEGLEVIEERCFQYSPIKSIAIPSTVRYIGDEAFEYCEYLESIEIPSSVTYLGISCFYRCYKLKSAIIGKGITKLQQYSFYDCIELENINILGNITYFGYGSICSGKITKFKFLPNTTSEKDAFGFGLIELFEIGENSVISFNAFHSACLNIILNDNISIYNPYYTLIYNVNVYYIGKAKYDYEVDQSLYYTWNFNNYTKVYVTSLYKSSTFCGLDVIHTDSNPFENFKHIGFKFSDLELFRMNFENPNEICDFNAYVTRNDAYFNKKVHKLVPSLIFCNSILINPK